MLTDVEYKKLYWHSRRGMRELDLVLLPFVENHLRHLSAADQQLYEQLLAQEDTDMFRWFLQAEQPADATLARMVNIILKRNRNTPLR